MAGGITDREAAARNRAWTAFKWWLQARSSTDLESADAGELARQFPPLPADQLAQMIELSRIALRRAERAGVPAPRLVS